MHEIWVIWRTGAVRIYKGDDRAVAIRTFHGWEEIPGVIVEHVVGGKTIWIK